MTRVGPIITPRHPGMTVGRKRSRGNDDHSKSGSSSQQDQQLPLVDKPKRSSSKNSKMPPPPPPIFKETAHFEGNKDTSEEHAHASKRSRVSAPVLSPRQADHVPRRIDDDRNNNVNVDSDDHLFDDFEFEMPPSTNDVAAQFEQFKRDSMSVDDHRPSSPGASQTYTDQDVAEHLLRNARHESIDTDREERERLYSETPFDNQDYRQPTAKQYVRDFLSSLFARRSKVYTKGWTV